MTYVFFYFCFFSLDCGIFTLKFMEIWRPRVLLTNQFSQKDIPNIRIQYVNKLFFHPCNIVLNSTTKKLVTDYYAKVSSHLNFFLKNMFFKFFSSVTFTFSFFFLFFVGLIWFNRNTLKTKITLAQQFIVDLYRYNFCAIL